MANFRIRTFVVVKKPRVQLGSSNEARWIRFPDCIDSKGNPVSVTVADPTIAFEMALRLLGYHAMVTDEARNNGS